MSQIVAPGSSLACFQEDMEAPAAIVLGFAPRRPPASLTRFVEASL